MDHLHNGDEPGLAAPASGIHDHAARLCTGGNPVSLIPKREAASGQAGRIEEQIKDDDADFLTGDANRKAIFTLVARCALRGVSLSQIRDDAGRILFIASQGAWTKELHSLDEVETFLRRLGGSKA